MFESFAEKESEDDRPQRDREFTLGPATLLGVLGGLVLLCGVSFGIGYTMGKRSSPSAAAVVTQSPSGETITAQPGTQLDKPEARGTIPSTPPERVYAQTSQPLAGAATSASNPLTSYAPTTSSPEPASAAPQVRPVLPAQASQPQSGSPAGAGEQMQPAAAQTGGLMVQVAAVSHIEDANVLIDALKKRGYAAAARREIGDNMIHVQVGPFASRAEADAMSQRLLSDGYNATVQQ